MSKPVARVGDVAFCKGDQHLFAGPLVVFGFIQKGSSNVYCNDRPVAICNPLLQSVHIVCPGPNLFYCKSGSDKVYCNDFQLARSGDPTSHCGSISYGAGGLGPDGEILPLCSLNTYAG